MSANLYYFMYPIKSGACLDDPKKSNKYWQADFILKLIIM